MLQYLGNYLLNFQVNKLDVVCPNLANILIISFFFGLVGVTSTKVATESNWLLSIRHTEQLKGLAIFFVVLGHLWVHVAKTKATIVFAGDAVALFLMLSGFGLSLSTRNKKLEFKKFCSRRIKRVMVPYWVATIVILSFDRLFLSRQLSVGSALMTFLGINLSSELRDLDYARWFVTFILVWYGLFFWAYTAMATNRYAIYLLCISVVLLPINYYFLHFGWYQFFSFPIGCLCAIIYDKLVEVFREKERLLLTISFVGLSYALSYKLMLSDDGINRIIYKYIPNILLAYLYDLNGLIVSSAVIAISGGLVIRGYRSKMLLFLGKYSYEIFLVHGVFLVKYNPIIKDPGTLALIVEFSLFMAFVSMFAILIFNISSSRPLKNEAMSPRN